MLTEHIVTNFLIVTFVTDWAGIAEPIFENYPAASKVGLSLLWLGITLLKLPFFGKILVDISHTEHNLSQTQWCL